MERINGRFAPGVSGNPSGLPGWPLGSRQAFSQGFLRDLAEVWRDHCVHPRKPRHSKKETQDNVELPAQFWWARGARAAGDGADDWISRPQGHGQIVPGVRKLNGPRLLFIHSAMFAKSLRVGG